MRRRLWWVLALLLLDCAASERMPESYEDDVEYDAEYDEDDDIEMPFAPAINKLASKVQRAVDSQGVLRARRYGNVANGVLLGATGSVTLLASVFSLQLSRVVLSVYMTAAGALLAGVELGAAPVAGWTKENLNWFTSHSGKTALLFFAGGLSWCAAAQPWAKEWSLMAQEILARIPTLTVSATSVQGLRQGRDRTCTADRHQRALQPQGPPRPPCIE